MIGYLHGSAIKQLLAAGVTQVWFGVSSTPGYQGDLTSVYFFNDEGTELAHQTQLAGEFGNPEVELLTRNWGGQISGRGYERSHRWNLFLAEAEDLIDCHIYKVI